MIPEIPEVAKNFFRDMDRRKFDQIEWDERDWRIWYHCVGFACWKIMRRTDRGKNELDYQI